MRIRCGAPHYEKSHSYRITKLFGDFVSRDYNVRERLLILKTGCKTFLQNLLEKDLLLVGIDLAWDQDILRLIPPKASGTVWFVIEEDDIVDKSSFLADIFRARHKLRSFRSKTPLLHFRQRSVCSFAGSSAYSASG